MNPSTTTVAQAKTGKLKTFATTAALLAALGLSAGALMMAYMNRPPPVDTTEIKAPDLNSVAGVKPDAAKGDRVVALTSAHQGGNTSVEWLCGKSLAGKHIEDHHGHWNHIGGAVAFNPKENRLLAVEVAFATASFQSDANALTLTVTADQLWFDIKNFPEARFAATEFTQRTPELEKEFAAGQTKPVEGWTHVLRGQFTLNGITAPLALPAKVAFGGESARIESHFAISRAAFKVSKRKNSLAGAAGGLFDVDDAVQMTVKVVAAPDVATLVSELGIQLQTQKGEIADLRELLKKSDDRAAKLDGALDSMKEELKAELKKVQAAASAAPAPKVDPASLPKSFTDELVEAPFERDYEVEKEGKKVKMHQSFRGLKAPFKMILVPGDPAKNIAPYYIGETEVTWDLFKAWSHWEDTTLIDAAAEAAQKLRPSNASSYADTSHGMGYVGTPAMGMSRLNAEKFCEFLSKQTGRTYRLPTEAEWELAHQLGGGDPADKAAKVKAAVCKENAPNDADDDTVEQSEKTFLPRVDKVKTKEPSKLGLHDMLGNVAEWVKTPGAVDGVGKNSFVRGGDFSTAADQLSGALREESNNERNTKESWNATYPNDPNSKWWYKDHFQVGFRLVCEPVNLPKN